MQRSLRAAVVLAALTVASTVGAVTWSIDPNHTTVGFGVRHLMVSTVRGQLKKVAGTVEVPDGDPTRATIEVTIDAASVDTGVEKRDAHLRGADFFDVARYPAITFRSKKVERAGEGRFRVTGDLTLHGVTREIVLDVDGVTPAIKDPWGNTRAGAHATTTVKRRDFGMTWNNPLEGGGVVLGEEVPVTVDVEATQAASGAKP